MTNDVSVPPPAIYTRQQVAECDGKRSSQVWIVIRDVVYNVTPYLSEHPGGAEMIEEYAGKDATKAFEDFGHSSDAKKTLKKFKIGELVDEDKTENQKKVAAQKQKQIEAEGPHGRSLLALITCGCLA